MDDRTIMEHISRVAQAVGRLERKTDFILKELKLEYHDDPEAGLTPELAQVSALIRAGKKLEAIQAYRQQTGADMNTARGAIEKIELGLTKS